MSQSDRRLIEDLQYNATVAGGKPLEQRLADTALWFHSNKDRIPREDLAKRLDFQERALWCLLEINALLLERLRETTGSKTLFLPSSVNMNGKRFS